jgi:hypothetical protein
MEQVGHKQLGKDSKVDLRHRPTKVAATQAQAEVAVHKVVVRMFRLQHFVIALVGAEKAFSIRLKEQQNIMQLAEPDLAFTKEPMPMESAEVCTEDLPQTV